MSTHSKNNCLHQLRRGLGVIAIVLSVVSGSVRFAAQAAVRLPEEAISVEPWLVPALEIPALVEPPPAREMPPATETPKRITVDPARATPDRTPRLNKNRKSRSVLVELMSLVGPPEEPVYLRSVETFQSCRQFVAVNC